MFDPSKYIDTNGHIDLHAYQRAYSHKDASKAVEMARYMKNKFPFIGIAAPERCALEKPIWKDTVNWQHDRLIQNILYYYALPEREYQYLAIDLIVFCYKRLSWEDWRKSLFPLIDTKPWWDSVDALRKPLGLWLKSTAERFVHLREVIEMFMHSASIWERRTAITVQLQYKEKTDAYLLSGAIDANVSEDEFFIQKAIGWALRDYSKTDPDWVRAFMKARTLSRLAEKEGGKYL